MKKYIIPSIKLYKLEMTNLICTSKITTPKTHGELLREAYSTLTWNQKIAALNLMMSYGGACSGTPQEIKKINHIMTVEANAMGVTAEQMQAGINDFSSMNEMANALIGVNKTALENLFWAFYNIIAVGRNEQAAHMLVSMYRDFGFSEEDCISILEKRTGKKVSEL